MHKAPQRVGLGLGLGPGLGLSSSVGETIEIIVDRTPEFRVIIHDRRWRVLYDINKHPIPLLFRLLSEISGDWTTRVID